MYGLGILKGMLVTLRTMLRTYGRREPPYTYQWPEENTYVSPRVRGFGFAWWEERCTGCATCAKSCPHGVIEVITKPRADGTYQVEEFRVDIAICMFCGLCVESCPYDALRYTTQTALSFYERDKMVMGKYELERDPERSSAYARPFVEEERRRAGKVRLPRWVEQALAEEARLVREASEERARVHSGTDRAP
jgi:formate hydrogenlyase subunit 6/NADH:ubiquinone oxidoreductase subunit I